MQLNRTSLVTEYRLVSRFMELRSQLLSHLTPDRLEKPLAHWALPHDRRLPLAFMGRSVRDLLESPIEDLLATPGVGQKKICGLLGLLDRVASEGATEKPPAALPSPAPEQPVASGPMAFDPNLVSEAIWTEWCESVKSYGLSNETLGRFAPSLEHLPRVLWHTPLGTYIDHSLAEIRQLKTHGEKRVSAILEVFWEVHRVVSHLGPAGNLDVRILPRIAGQLERWVLAALEQPRIPSSDALDRNLIVPLVNQARIDVGDQIADLIEGRLGLRGDGVTVRQTANELGLTRSRVYQLLAEAEAALTVRWPEGQYLVGHLANKIRTETTGVGYERFLMAVDLFFPLRPQGASLDGSAHPGDVGSHRRAG